MAATADSDAYVHSTTFLNPGDDLELERTSNFFTHVSDNTSTAKPGYPSIGYVPELNCFADGLAPQLILSQYNYPPPFADHDYRLLPYPKPSTPTSEPIAACYAPSNDLIKRAWAQGYSYQDGLTVAPDQTVFVDVGERVFACSYAKGVSVPETAVDPSKCSGLQPHTLQSVASHQNFAHIHPPDEPRTATSTNILLRDASTPYVPGTVACRDGDLRHLTDVLTAVVERPSYACSNCNKDCRTKSALTHHKITHNKDKSHRHKCTKCDAGFRYPKDLRRHNESRHGDAKHSCADCHKTYGRKDHLARHTLRSGHTALSESSSSLLASSVPTTASQQGMPSPLFTEAHQNIYPQLSYHSYDHDPSQDIHGIRSSPPPTRATYSYPALLEVPRSIPSFGFTGSLDGTGSFTASEVDSFASETFVFE